MKKRTFVIFFLLLALVVNISGCGGKKTSSGAKKETAEYEPDPILNEPGTFPVVKEEYKDTTIKIGIAQSTFVTDYEDNTFTQALEEKLGCNIEFEILPSTETMQKVELMIAAGGDELPDVLMMAFEDAQLYAYGRNGTFVDLKPYYENSAYYLNQMFESEEEKYGEDIKKYITLSDGSMYYVPSYKKALQNEYGTRMWMYQPWLDKLGLEKPETLEEFKEVLTAFKNEDPNGNGKADEIPVSGETSDAFDDFILASFLPIDNGAADYLYPDSKGKIQAGFMQDEWKEGLKYLNGLYNEGLLSDTKYTQDRSQFTQLNSSEEPRVGAFVSMSPPLSSNIKKRTLDYTHIKPLKNGEDGASRAVWSSSNPSCGMVVTKNCEHPELAFRLGDLMCEESLTIWNRWGEEGVDWVAPKEDEHSLFEDMGYKARISPILVWGTQTNHHWQNVGPGYRDYDVSLGQVASDSNYSEMIIAKAASDYLDAKPDNIVRKYIYDVDKLSQVAQYKADIRSYVDEQTALFITGNKDLDSDWDDYLDHLKTIGIEQYIELTQEAYDKNSK